MGGGGGGGGQGVVFSFSDVSLPCHTFAVSHDTLRQLYSVFRNTHSQLSESLASTSWRHFCLECSFFVLLLRA